MSGAPPFAAKGQPEAQPGGGGAAGGPDQCIGHPPGQADARRLAGSDGLRSNFGVSSKFFFPDDVFYVRSKLSLCGAMVGGGIVFKAKNNAFFISKFSFWGLFKAF